jgi:hypothetical protein
MRISRGTIAFSSMQPAATIGCVHKIETNESHKIDPPIPLKSHQINQKVIFSIESFSSQSFESEVQSKADNFGSGDQRTQHEVTE